MEKIENRTNPTKSMGNSSSGKEAEEEAMLQQNAEGNSDETIMNKKEEEVDDISVIRGRIQELSAKIGTIEDTCRNQSGSGWRIVCSSRAACDKLRQYNNVLEEIGDDKKIVHDRLHELSKELEVTRSELQLCGQLDQLDKGNNDEKKCIKTEVSSRSCGESPKTKIYMENQNSVTTTETTSPQQDIMERVNGPSHSSTADAATALEFENYDPVKPRHHHRQSSVMRHDDKEERKKLEKELIRVEKEMKYDYYFMEEVATGELKTSLQWLHDLKQQASETEDIINDELENLKYSWDMIAYQELRNEEARQRIVKWNSSRVEELNSKVMESKVSNKAEWPEQQSPSHIDKEINNKVSSGIDIGSSNEETPSSLQFSEQKTNQKDNRKNLEKAQKLAIDLTKENKFPKLVV